MISLRYIKDGVWVLRHKRVVSDPNWRRTTTTVTETRLDEDDMQDLRREIGLALDGGHYSGCVCADCSGAELTADNN